MREKIEGMLAELQQELQQATKQEAQARVVRLRLEGSVATLQILLQDDQAQPAPDETGVTDGSNN